ncbi:MAG: hypothetical protein ACRDUA_08080 [Micromonosporaceae bacterium]
MSYRTYVPERNDGRPALVLVHGRARAAAALFRAFLPMAVARNVPLLVPTFPRTRYHHYQQLAGVQGPLAARGALLAVLEDARSNLGASVDTIDLLGFSGGAQFAHRFAMLTTTRIRRLVVASAGWYTYLRPGTPFPLGAGASRLSGGMPVDVEAFLRLPVHVLVGALDTQHGPGLRTSRAINRTQGDDRLVRALRWLDHLEERAYAHDLGPRVTFDLMPDTGHSFSQAVFTGGLVGRAFEFLHPVSPDAMPLQETDVELLP